MKKFLPIMLIALAFASSLQAESSKKATPAPLPKGPLIVKPAGNLRTVITVTGPAAAKKGASGEAGTTIAMLKRIVIVQCGDIGVEQIAESGGKTIQTWLVGLYQAVCDPAAKVTIVSLRPPASQDDTSAANYYPGFEWVTVKNYSGLDKVQGVDCIVFKDAESESQAYVDLSTRLPVSATQLDMTYSYDFSEVAPGSITLPANIAKAMDDFKAHLAVGARRAARPF